MVNVSHCGHAGIRKSYLANADAALTSTETFAVIVIGGSMVG